MASVDPAPAPPNPPSWRDRMVALLSEAPGELVEQATWAWDQVMVRRFFTAVALLLAFFVLFLLPQTANILWQLPAMEGLGVAEMVLSLLLWTFLGALLTGYVLISWALVPAKPPVEGAQPRTSRLRDSLGALMEAPVRRAAGLGPPVTRRVGASLLVLSIVAIAINARYARDLPAWLRSHVPAYATFLGLLGLWLLCLPRQASERGFKVWLTGRALVILIVTTLFGDLLLWNLPDWAPKLVSPRIYTIWAIIQLAFLLVTGARTIDACQVDSGWNIRALVALGTIGWLLLTPSQQVGRFWRLPPRPTNRPDAFSSEGEGSGGSGMAGSGKNDSAASGLMPAVQRPPVESPVAPAEPREGGKHAGSLILPMRESMIEIWFRAMATRLAETDPQQPVIFVAASGGGARAAMFTALVLEALRNTPLPNIKGPTTASSSTSAAPNTSPPATGSNSLTMADQIVLISSVSGGSLASAYYVSQSYPHLRVIRDREMARDQQGVELVAARPLTRFAWRNAFQSELYARMHARALGLLDEARRGRGRAVSTWAGARFEESVERIAYECEALAEGGLGTQGAATNPAPIAPWIATSAFVDDMATDCMAPLLRGILTPGLERGVSVSQFWEDQFGWRDVEDTDLHRKPPEDRREPNMLPNGAPPVLFNTCDVTLGSRLILGFPPVPPGVIRDPTTRRGGHLPYSLTDRGDLYYHVSLAEAVRLSANFPFGFEVGRLALSGGDDTILALDGGIVDNSGIDSIVYLLQGMDRLAKAYRREWERLANQYSQARLDEDKKRLWEELDELSCHSLEGRAYRLLYELARRKVVLIQIDSGTKEIQTGMSSFSQLLAGMSPVMFRPFQALNNASYTNAELAVEQYDLALTILQPLPAPPIACKIDERLARLPALEVPVAAGQAPAKAVPGPSPEQKIPWPPPKTPPNPPLILRVRLTCNQSANIMTAWTLGPEEKAQVLVQFLIEWEHQKPVILKVTEIEARIALCPRNPAPGDESILILNDDLARDYQTFARGQKLADRARAEFYQLVSSPVAPSGTPAAGGTMPVDEAARQDIENYDQLFREKPQSPAPPAPVGCPPPPTPAKKAKPRAAPLAPTPARAKEEAPTPPAPPPPTAPVGNQPAPSPAEDEGPPAPPAPDTK